MEIAAKKERNGGTVGFTSWPLIKQMITLVGPYRKERARLRGALHIIHIALEEEGVTRGLLKQILPLERRRGSKLMWQSCGHQAVD